MFIIYNTEIYLNDIDHISLEPNILKIVNQKNEALKCLEEYQINLKKNPCNVYISLIQEEISDCAFIEYTHVNNEIEAYGIIGIKKIEKKKEMVINDCSNIFK